MCDKQTIVRSLERHTDGSAFISPNKLRKYLGRGGDYVKQVTEGLESLPNSNGRGNKYLIDDVAAKILKMKVKQ